jgi:NAD(P)-dependent dehydrogenase (short-subunit alcohol dehydrogenase family)
MGRFDGKVALVTGARTGIGKASALQFAREGAKVLVGVRKPGDGNDVIAEIRAAGGEAREAAMDTSKPEEVERGVAQAVQAFGKLDVLVINAGVEQPRTTPIDDLSIEEMNRTVDINLKGSWLAIHHAVPHLTKPGGAITLVSSLWGFLGGAGLSAYSAAKGGINAMTRSLAVEHGRDGVRVNCISPGAIVTPMLERFLGGNLEAGFNFKANVPLGRPGKAEEVAEAIAWISSDAASYVTGQVLGADGGQTIQMPVGN